MNMFKPVGAKSIDEYFQMLNEDRREALEYLDKIIKQTVPELEPHFAYNMLGYGKFKYKNYKGEILDWPVVALASQKNYISLYVCAIDKKKEKYLAEQYEKELGKVSIGKSCIRFKKLDDLNIDTLKKLLKEAEKTPGLVGAKSVD